MTGFQNWQRTWIGRGDIHGERSATIGGTATYPGPNRPVANAEVVDLVVGHHHLELERDESISSEDWAIGLVLSHMVAGGWPAQA